MSTRSLAERLTAQQALFGLIQTQPSPAITELAGMCGYDFLFLDREHGVFEDEDCLQALRIAAGTETLIFTRLRNQDPQGIGRMMDLGAQVLVVPNVTSAQQAKALVSAMVYPPAGTRGAAASLARATRYGMDLAAHMKNPRDGTSLMVIIESEAGVDQVEKIVAIEGVDGVIVGPADLSADLGYPRDYLTAKYTQALERIERAVISAGKLLGTAPHGPNTPGVLLSRGHRILIAGSDMSLIREGMAAQMATARECLERALAEKSP